MSCLRFVSIATIALVTACGDDADKTDAAPDVVDATDMLAVGTDNFKVFADLGRVYHTDSCRLLLARKTA